MVESAYYDLSRHLLDFPAENLDLRLVEVDLYLSQVEHLRDIGRKVVETGSPPELDFVTPLRKLATKTEQVGAVQPATEPELKRT